MQKLNPDTFPREAILAQHDFSHFRPNLSKAQLYREAALVFSVRASYIIDTDKYNSCKSNPKTRIYKGQIWWHLIHDKKSQNYSALLCKAKAYFLQKSQILNISFRRAISPTQNTELCRPNTSITDNTLQSLSTDNLLIWISEHWIMITEAFSYQEILKFFRL